MYSLKRHFDHPWNKRLYELAGAMGWSLEELGKRLGRADERPIRRILEGQRPAVEILLKLEQLEKAYEAEIKEFIRLWRPYARFHKYRQRYGDAFLKGRTKRPADLAEMGNLGAVGKDLRNRKRKRKRNPRKKVNWVIEKRRRYWKDRQAKSGRS